MDITKSVVEYVILVLYSWHDNLFSTGKVHGSQCVRHWDSLYEHEGPGDIDGAQQPILSGCQVSGGWRKTCVCTSMTAWPVALLQYAYHILSLPLVH